MSEGMLENTNEKQETASYLSYCRKLSPSRSIKCRNVWENVNDTEKEAFEKIVGKGENAGNQHFFPFPQCFLPFLKQSSVLFFGSHLFCCLQCLSNWLLVGWLYWGLMPV